MPRSHKLALIAGIFQSHTLSLLPRFYGYMPLLSASTLTRDIEGIRRVPQFYHCYFQCICDTFCSALQFYHDLQAARR